MRYLPFLSLFACIDFDTEDDCANYISYMCECHAEDPDFECSELQNLYENPDADQQSECALALDEQIYSDSGSELTCDPSDTSATEL